MRSSKRLPGAIVVAAAAMLANCASAPGAASAPSADCVSKNAAVDELRQTIEVAPLYTLLASSAPLGECRVVEEGGRLVLDYTFTDGGQLHVERDERIEFMLQEARLAAPRALDAREILTRAERAAFGEQGCGIAWERGDSKPMAGAAAVQETVYWGTACNCQARVRKDRDGRVAALILRSAC